LASSVTNTFAKTIDIGASTVYKSGVYGDAFYAIIHGTVGSKTSSTNPIIYKLNSAGDFIDSCYDFTAATLSTFTSTFYTITSAVESVHTVYISTGTIATVDYLASMTTVDLLTAANYYITPDSQKNSTTPNEACKHRNPYITSAFNPTYTHYVTDGQTDWTMQFAQQQAVPFNVTVLNETAAAFNPGSWFVVDYVNFDTSQSMIFRWLLQDIPTFYELSMLYQINIKVRLYH
jgi:hypothetical protein